MIKKGIFYVSSSDDMIHLRLSMVSTLFVNYRDDDVVNGLKFLSTSGPSETPFELKETQAVEYIIPLTALHILIEKFEDDARFNITRLYLYNLYKIVFYGADIQINS